MPRSFLVALGALLAALLPFASPAPLPPDADFAALRAALVLTQLPSPTDPLAAATQRSLDAAVPALIASLSPAGLWPDVTYNDPADRSEWLAAEHLRRCLILGISSSARNAASAFAGDARALNATLSCTRGWLAIDPQNSNWWWVQLGAVQAIAKLLLLAPSPPSLAAAAATVFPRLSLADVAGFAGANRVWGAFIYALVGAASGDASRVDAAAPLLHGAMYAGLGDGIQADASFHQHGPLAYFSYGYGAHFVGNALTMEAAARGTRWAMNASAWAGLARFILDGARWTVRGSEFNIGLMGRHNVYFAEVDSAGVAKGHYHSFAAYAAFALAFPPLAASPGTLGAGAAPAAAPFSSALAAHYARLLPAFASAPRGAELLRFAEQVAAGDGSASATAGHAHFFLSDAAAHVRARSGGARGTGFALVLHLFSNRTLNSECVNGEGAQNRAVADGLLTAQVTGAEYRDVAPAWRWSLAPGTTELQTPAPYECADAQVVDAAERRVFVGGAGDDWMGAAALDFRRVDAGAALTARKSWAFLEEGAVALGAAIAADGRFNATTALEQRRLAGPVWVGVAGAPPALVPAGALLEAADVDWVWHDGAVLIPSLSGGGGGGQFFAVSTRTQHGAWSSVVSGAPNATVATPMFLAYVHHGAVTAAAPGAYAYAVLPDAAATPAAAAAAAAAFRAATIVVEASASRHALCRAAPNATLAWLLTATDWPPAAGGGPRAAAAARGGGGGSSGGVCPSVSVSAPSVTLVALSRDFSTLTVTAASPLAGSAAAPLVVSVAGARLSGAPTPACRASAGGGGGVDVVLALPPPPFLGASVSAACAVAAPLASAGSG